MRSTKAASCWRRSCAAVMSFGAAVERAFANALGSTMYVPHAKEPPWSALLVARRSSEKLCVLASGLCSGPSQVYKGLAEMAMKVNCSLTQLKLNYFLQKRRRSYGALEAFNGCRGRRH